MRKAGKLGNRLAVPPNVQRKAGIKNSDRLKFSASPKMITITVDRERTYRPTQSELAAILRGEAEVAKGEFVTLAELLHELGGRRRKVGAKKARKLPS